jgi:hypothetical protein
VSPDGVRVAFQLDRFEQTGEDRLEVAGRWYGVRGLRFVRPALTVQTKDGERNLLAVLEHKPWAAEEGEAWIAAFPWEGDSPDPGQAELAVAPSVVVALSEDEGAKGQPGRGRRTLSERLVESEQRVRRLESEVAWLREEREALLADKGTAGEEAAALRADLAEARRAGEAAAAESEAARAERDSALRERDEASAAREAAAQSVERAQAALAKAGQERDAAMAARDSAIAEFEAAVRQSEEAARDSERARQEHDALAAERDEAFETSRRALAERDAALGRGSGFPAVSAADLDRQPHSPPAGRQARTGRRLPAMADVDPISRAIAVGALVVLLLLVIVLLKVA